MVVRADGFSVFIFCVCVLLFITPVNAQYGRVRYVTAGTADRVVFGVKVEQQVVASATDVVLFYTVTNNGSKPIYLVHEKSPRFENEDGIVLVEAPIPIPTGHGGYDYTFTKIAPKKTYKNQIFIPGRMFKSYDVWPLEVAFGYVTDITGLNRRLNKGEDPAALRGLLNSRMTTVAVGKLSVEVKP
jgi:hypothetical protein